MAVLTRPTPASVSRWPAPARATGAHAADDQLYALDVRMWDMHAARTFRSRLLAAGVDEGSLGIRGRRCADGLVEADIRPWKRMTMRWKVNVVVAIASAFIVGAPMGASTAMIFLGEHAVVMTAGALIGGFGLAATGLLAVWGDHFQRFAGSRNESRLEGLVTITGSQAVVRAEMLLTATDDVMSVQRVPVDNLPDIAG